MLLMATRPTLVEVATSEVPFAVTFELLSAKIYIYMDGK
jgi:hypothetical protein